MKDYAKRPTRPVRNKSSNSAWFNNLMLLLAIFFAGFACFHLIQEHPFPKLKPTASVPATPIAAAPEKKETVAKKTEHKKSAKKIKSDVVPTATADFQPKFDFYKLLPQMTVKISTDDDSTASVMNNKMSAKKSTPTYVLQVAALQKNSDATQVQNTLKAAGYAAFTQPYLAPDHTTWYRVLVGPFNDLKTAQVQQDKLDAHQTEALLTTMK